MAQTVNEIRDTLKNEYNVTDEETLKQSKGVLNELLAKLENEKNEQEDSESAQEVEDVFGDVEEDEDVLNDELEIPEIVPPFFSTEWSDYVMRQFLDSELVGEYPTCDGCRRLVQNLIGPITAAGVQEYTPASTKNSATATVVFNVSVYVTNDQHPAWKTEITMSDIADVNKYNTDPPYHKHPSATAATRAEGRIYRKLLGLNAITAEEKSEAANSEEEWVEDDIIDQGQVAVIDMMCKPNRCDLSVIDFINCGKNKYTVIDAVPRSIAAKMIQKLNQIQQGISQKPKGVGRYEADWRK